jgi:hypothetical protein
MAQAGIRTFVAPVATAHALERWGPSFDRVRQYATEMGLTVIEVEL